MPERPLLNQYQHSMPNDSESEIFGPRFGKPSNQDNQIAKEDMKTGTTLVGLTTSEGVVMASDRRASLGGRFVTDKNAQKVEQIHPTAAFALSGAVSSGQSLIHNLRSEVSLYETRRGKRMSMQALSTLTANLLRSGAFIGVVPIIGGVDDDGRHVYDFDGAGSVSDEDYVAGGSGMQVAYGVLEKEYESDLSNDDGVDIVARAVQSASERDTASGNGINLAEITDTEVEITHYDEIETLLN